MSDTPTDAPEGQRLAKRVVELTGCSRSEAEHYVQGGWVRVDGEVVARLRSVAYGHTVKRTLGYVYLPASLAEGARLEVEVLGGRVPAVVTADAVVDPAGDRMRG